MNNLFSDFLLLLFLSVFVYGIKPMKPISAINPDYLSIDTTKQYRGLFSILIVFHHLGQQSQVGYVFDDFVKYGFLAVGFFFFVSGYGMQKSYMSKGEAYRKKFLVKRIPSVLIPYLVVTALYWVVNYMNGKTYSVIEILTDTLHGEPIALYSWFIIIILLIYCFYWLLMSVCKKRYVLFLVLGGIGCMAWTAYCLLMSYGYWWYISTPAFLIGLFWAIYENTIIDVIKKNRWIIPCTWVLTCLLLVCGDQILLLPIPKIHTIRYFVCVMCFLFSVLFFSMKFIVGNKILSFFGDISLEIYLIHGLFILLYRSNIVNIENDSVLFVLVIVSSICSGLLLHFLFGKLLKSMKVVRTKILDSKKR